MTHLVPYDPFEQLVDKALRRPFFTDLLEGWPQAPQVCQGKGQLGWTPAVDVREDEKEFIFTADIPGVDPKEVQVTLEDGYLTIKGERKEEYKENKNGYHRIERKCGMFARRFKLPDTVDVETVTAKGKDGVLEVRIPKKEAAVPKKIKVQ